MSRNLEPIFACRSVICGLLKLNIKARQDIPEFLTANLYRYMLLHWTKIRVEFFLLAQFFPKAHQPAAQQLVDLRKMRAEKLKFR